MSYPPRTPGVSESQKPTRQLEAVPPDTGDDDARVGCALCGLFFSWIPIVGILTYIVNADAQPNTARHALSRSALSVSMIIILFNIIFWPIFLFGGYYYHDR